MNKIFRTILTILLTIIATILVLASFAPEEEESYSPTTIPSSTVKSSKVTSPNADSIWEDYRFEFINGCKEGNEANYAYCECVVDYLEDNYSRNDIYDMSVDYLKTEEIGTMLIEGATNCISFYTE